jgi:hypothetical protein
LSRFLYASYVSDDIDEAVSVLETLGMPCTWRGKHPFFGVDSAICAMQKGGLMVMAATEGDGAHDAVSAYVGQLERMFHCAIAGLPDGWEDSDKLATISDPYDGPCGSTRALEFRLPDGGSLWMEAMPADAEVGDPGSRFLRMESTPMVSPKLADLEDAIASVGLAAVDHLSGTAFPTLAANSHIFLLEDWHFLELNEPTGDGIMGNLLSARGSSGIFGVSIQPVDLDEFARTTREAGIRTNTKEAIVLPVTVDGKPYDADEIITLPPKATGGARIFVLNPMDYPWKLL